MTSYYEAQLTARKIMQDTGLSLREVASLDLDEYARLSGHQTPAEAARAAIAAQYEQEQPPAPAAPQTAPQPPAPQGIDPDSYEYFLAWRASRTSGGEGRGIFDSVSSQSDVYRDAVRAQTGRTALSLANVQEAPRIARAYIQHTQAEGRQPGYRGQ